VKKVGIVPGAETFVDVLRLRADEDGSRPAFSWLDESGRETECLTFAELDGQARAIAGRLQGMGGYGKQALLVFPGGLSFIPAFFGCLYAGTIAVPANIPSRRRKDDRLASITHNSQADFLLSTSPFTSKKEEYCSHDPNLADLKWLATDQISSTAGDAWRRPQLEGTDIAFLQYTSGSTAEPKGVIITHDNLMANQARLTVALKTDGDDVYVSWIPFFHDLGLVGAIMGAVYVGCRSFHFAPAAFLQRPRIWLEAITHYKGTLTAAPNFAYDLCTRVIKPADRAGLDLSSLRAAVNAAEPVRAETQERFVTAFKSCGFRPEHFAPTYGLAEATLFVSGGVTLKKPVVQSISGRALMEGAAVPISPGAPEARTFVACGRVSDPSGIKIVDPDSLVECDPGQVGELWTRNPHISPGYWNNPEVSKATFQAFLADSGDGPFLRTSDLGFILDDHLFISGRLKDLIIIRGHNYFPQDIELSVQRCHPALQLGSGAAFGVDSGYEELLVVAQEVRHNYKQRVDIDEIAAAARRAVALDHGVSLDGLILIQPLGISKTTSGKIRRLATREAFLDGSLKALDQWLSFRLTGKRPEESIYPLAFQISADAADNVSQIREWVYWRLGQLPGMSGDNIDLKQPFASYGLDSIVVIQLVNELAEWLNQPVELAELWSLQTIEALVEHLALSLPGLDDGEASDEGAAAIEPGMQIGPEEAERLINRLDDLSEAEVDTLLSILEQDEPAVGGDVDATEGDRLSK